MTELYNDLGQLHCLYGPAVENEYYSMWYVNGTRHNPKGPATITSTGDEIYYYDGKLHNLKGPAIKHSNGFIAYYENGDCHNLKGPAVVYPSGIKEWWFKGIKVSEECINKMNKQQRKLKFKYWSKWLLWLMDPYTKQGERYMERRWKEIENICKQ